MNTTILFFWLVAQGYLAPAQTVEFDDPAACQTALKQLSQTYSKTVGYAQDVTGVCVTKATPAPPPSPTCTFMGGKSFCTPTPAATN